MNLYEDTPQRKILTAVACDLKLVTNSNIADIMSNLSSSMAALVKHEFKRGSAVAVSEDGTVYTGAIPEAMRDAADAAEFTAFKAEAV
jgi:hypothetical protein